MAKKIITGYVSDRHLYDDDDPDVVSEAELIAYVSKRTGIAKEKVRIILESYGSFIKQELDENGQYLLKGDGDEDILLKKLEFH